ncbi:MAG: divergent polysaccharide deacetylase family protein [Hyphomicrobiaceae bacterium]|nr:divergent polysaccharide deacetylase family protein [Hyphomicrobiaceae bacterium]
MKNPFSKLFSRKKAPPPEPAEEEEVADAPDASESKRRRFRLPLPAIPRPSGPVAGTLVVVAALTGLGAWLALHGDETVSKRVVQVPRVLVPLDGRAANEEPAAETKEPAKAPAMAEAPKEPPKEAATPGPGPQVSLPSMAAVPPAAAPPAQQATAAAPARPSGRFGPPLQLKKAPEPGMIEQGPKGPLPIIAEDGRQAWRVYARPFDDSDKRPRIAIIITDLGPSAAATTAAIQNLPGAVTLAFTPYGSRVSELVEEARAAGHETLMAAPSEPPEFPRNDPGPYTLLAALSPAENLDRLEYVLSRVPGYVGVVTTTSGRFFANEEALQPVLTLLRRRGLLYVDGRGTPKSVAQQMAAAVGLPRAYGNRFLDAEASRGAIDNRLAELERIARESGSAIGIGQPYPVTIERIAQWVETLDGKGLALAPITAVVDRQPQ